MSGIALEIRVDFACMRLPSQVMRDGEPVFAALDERWGWRSRRSRTFER